MEEDLDMLCNSLNAVASLIAPTHIKIAELLLRAQAVISEVKKTEWKDAVNSIPTIEERVVGKWIDHKEIIYTDPEIWGYSQECSLCGFTLGAKEYNYCPNCGAKMERRANDNME